ncbi:hypothetical protein IF650_13965 [Cellulosimicrobium terreum]|nr:hypothetical protein [Cellulosimicrobium terreum]
MEHPENDEVLAPYLRAPAVEHALARPNRGAIRILTCSAVHCTYTVDRGSRAPAANEREHVAFVAALQLAVLAGEVGGVVTSAAQVDALGEGTIVLSFDGRPRRRGPSGKWHAVTDPVGRPSTVLVARGPAVVLTAQAPHHATRNDAGPPLAG